MAHRLCSTSYWGRKTAATGPHPISMVALPRGMAVDINGEFEVE